jgi:hypothetical protein
MGVAGLSTNLEPYAESCALEKLAGYTATIDGPGLAYHAHRIASEADPSRCPSYSDIYETALQFLARLEDMNITV